MPKQDTVKAGKDHPLLSRFAGAKLVGYAAKEFDAASLVAGKVPDDAKRKPEKELALEGRTTRLIYNFAPERSGLEVMRNHEAALQAAGFITLFSCATAACGKDFGEMMLARIDAHMIEGSTAYWEPFNHGRDAERYLLARGTRPDGSVVHAAIYVVDPVDKRNGGVLLDIVEARAMDTGKVTANLSAETMAKNIASEGKVAIYGVYFDTDKAEVKPQSKAALDEMAKLLKSQPELKVYIVGHTDAQGTLAHNLELSQRRADAVVKALEGGYKIDGRRMLAKGVASLAPVASNDAEAGREKNRRVELVKQ
ncbi:OmpA family protein [Ideonella sp. BN130291]|uniref:OmpA family protein n=1 Tax=Ideonella sp. BN130291 TaxID=3112940 RepID=UPI002E263202|nr:OmpA family protein [Ideonella sp. BN130291]